LTYDRSVRKVAWQIEADRSKNGPSVARRYVAELLGRESIAAEHVENIVLLVSELVTNAIRHAGLPPSAAVGLSVEVAPQSIRVDVVDGGEGFAVPTVRPLGSKAVSGFGLLLVDRLADRWGVNVDGVTSVWFEIDRFEEA
jgi:anti-sigma regulatory factor (Ser/Thr protein kinase)